MSRKVNAVARLSPQPTVPPHPIRPARAKERSGGFAAAIPPQSVGPHVRHRSMPMERKRADVVA
jgi:hypothetical protein